MDIFKFESYCTLLAHSVTWTTDGFFRETFKKNCQLVEMECSELRKVSFGQLLYAADSLEDFDNYDERNWGKNGIYCSFSSGADILVNLK